MQFTDARHRLIVAMDVDTEAEALALVEKTKEYTGYYKVGLQLYIQLGPDFVRRLKGMGAGIFLDLKLHDIPNTILSAAKGIAGLGVDMFTVHCLNGQRGLAACKSGLAEFCASQGLAEPLMLGVTVLTSMDGTDLQGVGIPFDPAREVDVLAGAAYAAGLRGFIASAREVSRLKQQFKDVVVITPGIRPAGAEAGDQSRVMTPASAIQAGADALVVGRPVTAAADPALAARLLMEEIQQALG